MKIERITASPEWDEACADKSEGLLAFVIHCESWKSEQDKLTATAFLTHPSEQQQVGVVRHSAGHVITPHVHLATICRGGLHPKTEVLLVLRGRLRLRIYTSHGVVVRDAEVGKGDVVVLLAGGHSLEMLEDCELLELKSGPYDPTRDKIPLAGPDLR